MSFFNQPPAPETDWQVPAITPGTLQVRNFARFGRVRYPYRTSLRIDNHRGAATLTFRANGRERTVGPGAVLTVKAEEIGPIYHYSIDATVAVGAGVVVVYENGGLTRAD